MPIQPWRYWDCRVGTFSIYYVSQCILTECRTADANPEIHANSSATVSPPWIFNMKKSAEL